MGLSISLLFERPWSAQTPHRILMVGLDVGLDAAGNTTVLYQL